MKRWRRTSQPVLTGFGGVSGEADTPNSDLVGRTFSDGKSDVRVFAVSHTNPAQVVLVRESDGHTWPIQAGIVRLIVGPGGRKRRAA